MRAASSVSGSGASGSRASGAADAVDGMPGLTAICRREWPDRIQTDVRREDGSLAGQAKKQRADLIAFVQSIWPHIVAALEWIDELPRSAIGKVLKRELRDRYAARSGT